jgi:hypothetical protein
MEKDMIDVNNQKSRVKHWEEVDRLFGDDDAIFHYTNMEKALVSILQKGEFWFCSRSRTDDPFENGIQRLTRSNSGINRIDLPQKEAIGRKVYHLVEKMIDSRNVKLMSFCSNSSLENSHQMLYGPDRYGFLKPRMWSQYGDRFRGVCLAFSKRKLIEQIEKQIPDIPVYHHNIIYSLYKEIGMYHPRIETRNIDENSLDYVKNFIPLNAERLFFVKHDDFRDENEFRVIAIDETGEKEHLSIDIAGCLKGLFVAQLLVSDDYGRAIYDFAVRYGVSDVVIDWHRKPLGISILYSGESPSN